MVHWGVDQFGALMFRFYAQQNPILLFYKNLGNGDDSPALASPTGQSLANSLPLSSPISQWNKAMMRALRKKSKGELIRTKSGSLED